MWGVPGRFCSPSLKEDIAIASHHDVIVVQSLTHAWLLVTHGLQHARLPCPSPSPRVSSNSYLLRQWCHPTISSPVVPISFCHQSFPASGSFPKNRLFESGGQSIGVSASASFLSVNIQGWFPLGLTGLISLLSKGLSRVFSSITVQKHQFFDTQPSLWLTMSSSHHRLPDIRAGASFVSASWPITFQQPPSLVPSPCGLKFQQTTLLGIIWSRATAKWRVWFWNQSIYPEWIRLSRTLVFCHMSLSSPVKLRADMKEVTRGFQKQLCWESLSPWPAWAWGWGGLRKQCPGPFTLHPPPRAASLPLPTETLSLWLHPLGRGTLGHAQLSVHRILRAITLEWVAMPFSRASCWPRGRTHISCSSCIAGRFFTAEQTGKPGSARYTTPWPSDLGVSWLTLLPPYFFSHLSPPQLSSQSCCRVFEPCCQHQWATGFHSTFQSPEL